MRVRKEIRFWIGLLLIVQIAVIFGVIQLLTRMGPAIATILQENVYSISAVEGMLSALALTHADESERVRFESALDRAASNITEEEERPVIEAIREAYRQALNGEPDAVREVVHGLQKLGAINRKSMAREDDRAQLLGYAGAWAAVILGFGGFLTSLFAIRRLTLHIVVPLEELHRALQEVWKGDSLRRVSTANALPEIRKVGEIVNTLLEEMPNRG